MPLIKPTPAPGTLSEVKPPEFPVEIPNNSASPIDQGLTNLETHNNNHQKILESEGGLHPINEQSAQIGGKKSYMRKYKLLNTNLNNKYIKGSNSYSVAEKVFSLLRKNKYKNRKIIILDMKTNRRYKYVLTKTKLTREFLH